MLACFYSDLHVSHRHNDYMEFLGKTLAYLGDLVRTRKPDVLINCGDTLDTFASLDVRDGVYASRALQTLTGLVGRHIILRGNHDTADREGNLSSTQLVCPHGATLVDHATLLDVSGEHILFIPHTRNLPEAREQLLGSVGRGVSAAVAHTDWLGCQLTPAYVSKEGLDPAEAEVPVFAGHYHAPVTVGRVHFVGSPLYKDFSDVEVERPRGFLFWDSATGGIERVANPHTYKCLRIEADTKKDLVKKVAAIGNPSACRVKVYVPKKLMEEAKEACQGCLWSAVYPIGSETQSVTFASTVTLRTSPEDAVRAAVKSAGEEYDRSQLESVGMEAMRGADNGA
jgi:predicted phosphodiesterase